jgi:hypothetical protein
MTLQYSLYLGINTSGRKVFHAYYYRLSVPHTVRAHNAIIIAAYCYDTVTVLPKYRNNNFPPRSALSLKRQIKYFKILII